MTQGGSSNADRDDDDGAVARTLRQRNAGGIVGVRILGDGT
jgi:hypothetical protein